MRDLQRIIDQMEAGADSAFSGTLSALGGVVGRLVAARRALQRFGGSSRPSRRDLDEAVDRADIARDLGSVLSGLVEISRGQPRVQRLNNELAKLRGRAKAHNAKLDALRLRYVKLSCHEIFPL